MVFGNTKSENMQALPVSGTSRHPKSTYLFQKKRKTYSRLVVNDDSSLYFESGETGCSASVIQLKGG